MHRGWGLVMSLNSNMYFGFFLALFVYSSSVCGQNISNELQTVFDTISKARVELIILLEDKKDESQFKKVMESATEADHYIKDIKVPGKEIQISELVKVWSEFRLTRENEIVPLVRKGQLKEASELAYGIQSERLQKIYDLLRSIQRKAPPERTIDSNFNK
jgi:hypothetical protein